jgi:hypothetical protein
VNAFGVFGRSLAHLLQILKVSHYRDDGWSYAVAATYHKIQTIDFECDDPSGGEVSS